LVNHQRDVQISFYVFIFIYNSLPTIHSNNYDRPKTTGERGMF